MFENPKAEMGMVEEGDGLSEDFRRTAEGRGDFEVLPIEVDGVVVVHAAGRTKRELEIEQGDETFLEGAEAALDFAFGLGSGSHQMGDAQGAQGALEFALWIGVVAAGAWSEEAEGIGIDGLGQAPGLEGQAEVLEVVPGGVGVHEAAGEVEAGVVVDGEQQGLLRGGGPQLVDGAVELPESNVTGNSPAHLFPSSKYPFACAVDEDSAPSFPPCGFAGAVFMGASGASVAGRAIGISPSRDFAS